MFQHLRARVVMPTPSLVLRLVAVVLAVGCGSSARPSPPPLTDTDRLIRDLCPKQIAVLGEANMHGGAATLEGLAFASALPGTTLRYFDRAKLTALGPRTARPLTYQPTDAAWASVVDGLVVQREERAPSFVPAPPVR
jgi:hypothetical protein